MLIDTHCHLDAPEFDADRTQLIAAARAAGIGVIVLPAVMPANFEVVARMAADTEGVHYALGIHPLYVDRAAQADIGVLRAAIERALPDRRFVAIGEIGLDHFIAGADRERQRWFFEQQLRLARDFALPVILHLRRAQDHVLAGLRKFDINAGIAHAFNGSADQAARFIARGFALGFGGAMTYDGSRRIRRLAQQCPLESIVLETDAPDIAPQWIARQRNEPAQLARIGELWAQLRGIEMVDAAEVTSSNARRVLPRLDAHLSAIAGAGG